MANTKNIEDVDYIEISPLADFVADTPCRPAFQKRDIEIKLNSLRVLQQRVWFGLSTSQWTPVRHLLPNSQLSK